MRVHGMTRNAAALLCGLFLSLSAVTAQADKRVALVIGNSAYQNAPTLPNPARDARAMAAMFQNAGYDVTTAYDMGNLDLKRAIRRFEDAASDSDIAVVYFAGHGIEIHGINYVIPVDARLASDRDAEDEAVTLDRLAQSLEGAKRLRLVILDACRDNPFARKMQQRTAFRGVTPGLAMVEPTSINTLIAYAAKAGAAADDGDSDHSPFTAALLNNLFVPGLDVRLALGRARDEVLGKTRNQQEPFVYGSLGGANIALVAAPQQPPKPVVDLDRQRADYSQVDKIDTEGGWQAFLVQYPTGFYADLARERLAVLDRADKAGAEEAQRAQAEKDRLAAAQAERDRLERARAAQQQAEQAGLAAEQAERDQLERERAAVEQRMEQARVAVARAERERLEAERAAKQQAEQARLTAAQVERDRLAAAQAETDRLAKEQAERDRLAQQQIETAKAAAAVKTNAEPAPAATGNDAAAKIALLTPPAEPAPPQPAKALTGTALVVAIKQELKRVGCYLGSVDDKWSNGETKSALKKFVKYAKLPDTPDDPAADFLDSVRGKTGRVCPLECGVREVEKNGACVAKICPSGTSLDRDGDCERNRPEKSPPSRRAAKADLAPEPAPQAGPSSANTVPCRGRGAMMRNLHKLSHGGCGY